MDLFFSNNSYLFRKKPTVNDILNSHFLTVNYGETWEGENAIYNERPKLCISGRFIGVIKNEKEKREVEKKLIDYEVITNLNFITTPEIPKSFAFFGLDNSYLLKSQIRWEEQNPTYIDLSYPIKKYLEANNLQTKIKKKNKWKFWK